LKKNPEDDGHVAILRAIKLTSAIAALVLFFMPWIDIQCSGKSLATQTGIQTITGMATPSSEIEGIMKNDRRESLGSSVLVATALLATGLGIACLLMALFNGNSKLDALGSILCVLALMCLLTQLIQGFPIKQQLIAKISMDQASNPMGMSDSLGFMMAANIQTVILPGFIATCSLLGIPSLLMVSILFIRPEPQKLKER